MPDTTYPYWLGVAEWLKMPKDQQEDIRQRYALVGGAMKVFKTKEEADAEIEKHLSTNRY